MRGKLFKKPQAKKNKIPRTREELISSNKYTWKKNWKTKIKSSHICKVIDKSAIGESDLNIMF